jgi:hypothetical protein
LDKNGITADGDKRCKKRSIQTTNYSKRRIIQNDELFNAMDRFERMILSGQNRGCNPSRFAQSGGALALLAGSQAHAEESQPAIASLAANAEREACLFQSVL